ncbi:MAG: glycosyltransferase family 4 protein [Bacteriovorax sp.]|nr:glycosyltransferase family 4 protein [Bacteriovorax sp.]
MKYKKIALISKSEISSWKSCQSIISNLSQAYLEAFQKNDLKNFRVVGNYNPYQAYKTAQELKTWGADLIIWLDHHPSASLLVEALDIVYEDFYFEVKPRFIIHLFGDFVLDCLKWECVKKQLKKWPLHFIVASEKQKILVDSFFESKIALTSVMPFPVDTKIFNAENSLEERDSIRKKFGIREDEKIIIYSGRISYQKNTEVLIKIFQSIEVMFENKVHLFIAGPWDDILLPYFGKHGLCGSYYAQFSEAIKNISKSNIHFIGQFKSLELKRILNSADLFISLSTYNDEDYGMAPAEALCCGLPCLLSDWAGYSSFKHYSDQVSLIPVVFSNSKASVDTNTARKMILKKILNLSTDHKKKEKLAEVVHSSISIEAVVKKNISVIDNIQFGPVSEFTPLFERVCGSFKKNPRSTFEEDLYKEVYASYGI